MEEMFAGWKRRKTKIPVIFPNIDAWKFKQDRKCAQNKNINLVLGGKSQHFIRVFITEHEDILINVSNTMIW